MRSLFIVVSFLFLLAAIPLGVFLVREQSSLGAKADTPTTSKVEFVGPSVKDFRASSPDVKVQVMFIPTSQTKAAPTALRLANDIASLDKADKLTFTSNNQIVEWKLSPGNGQKVVYVQFNIAGSWSSPISNTIILEGQSDQAVDVPVEETSPSTPLPSPVIDKAAFDLNSDGEVNDKDLVIIQQKIENKTGQPDDQADFNKDGLVNSGDYTMLLRQIQSNN